VSKRLITKPEPADIVAILKHPECQKMIEDLVTKIFPPPPPQPVRYIPTRRDYFAASCLSGLMARDSSITDDVKSAVSAADKLIAALEAKP
jgi:hypothetical protein